MGKLDGKVAIVTASAGAGIGQAILRRFAAEGAKVVVTDAHERRTMEVYQDLKSKGYECIGVPCDVRNWEQVQNLVNKTIEAFGKVDILVNNAGINRIAKLQDVTDEIWDLVLGVNLRGTFYCSKAVLPHMLKQKWGRIISISSAEIFIGSPMGEVPYATAKAGIVGFSRCLAREVIREGITVNVIAPGFIPNPFLERIYGKEGIKAMEEAMPMGKGGRPEDIAAAATFLASDEAYYITGCIICVSGGLAFW